MIFTDEVQVENQQSIESTSDSVRAFIKVKQPNGTFKTIIPITNTISILGTSGKTVDLELAEIISRLNLNGDALSILSEDTATLTADMSSLVEYVNPLMEELKSHIEVVDTGDEIENNIFNHVYEEIDSVVDKITNLEKSLDTSVSSINNKINELTNRLNNVISENANLATSISTLNTNLTTLVRNVNTLSTKLASHEDTIV